MRVPEGVFEGSTLCDGEFDAEGEDEGEGQSKGSFLTPHAAPERPMMLYVQDKFSVIASMTTGGGGVREALSAGEIELGTPFPSPLLLLTG